MLFYICFVTIIGCSPKASIVYINGPSISEVRNENPSEKKTIAVMDFDNSTNYQVSDGMQSMLISALFHTNKFIVVEREHLRDLLLEQKLGKTGVVSKETAVEIGKIEGAEFMVFGTITEFNPRQKGISTVAGAAQNSLVTIDVRIVDTKTGRIVNSTTVKGEATDIKIDTGALQYAGVSQLFSLEVYRNTSMETAIRICIDEAVKYIITKI
jgi:curli biogenesis system outer membrane secretion channel CsgG